MQVLLPLGSPMAAALPRRLAEALADRAGTLTCKLNPVARRVAGDNLRQLLGGDADDGQVQGVFRTYARYYLAMMRLAHCQPHRAVGEVVCHGGEALDASLARGRGALVLSAHFGNWDVAGMTLAQRYGGLCVFVEALRPDAIFDFYTRVRQRHAVRSVAAGVPSRLPLEVLRRNGLLGAVADRPFGVRRVRVPCGSGDLELPTGAIRLALRAGAAIHTVFAARNRGGFIVHIGPDLLPPVSSVPDEAQRLRRIGMLFADSLCRTVRQYPDQWCLLQRVGPLLSDFARRGAA